MYTNQSSLLGALKKKHGRAPDSGMCKFELAHNVFGWDRCKADRAEYAYRAQWPDMMIEQGIRPEPRLKPKLALNPRVFGDNVEAYRAYLHA